MILSSRPVESARILIKFSEYNAYEINVETRGVIWKSLRNLHRVQSFSGAANENERRFSRVVRASIKFSDDRAREIN